MSQETRSNAKPSDQTPSRYVIRRCEQIRQNFKDGLIMFPEAHRGVSAYLRVAGTTTIDQMQPSVWLVWENE